MVYRALVLAVAVAMVHVYIAADNVLLFCVRWMDDLPAETVVLPTLGSGAVGILLGAAAWQLWRGRGEAGWEGVQHPQQE